MESEDFHGKAGFSFMYSRRRILAAGFAGLGAAAINSMSDIKTVSAAQPAAGARKPRARDLGVPLGGTPGPLNAITDVAGIAVGHVTLISGEGPLVVGRGPVRTGVTALLPRGAKYDPVFAATTLLNGNGDMTGTHWIEESGFLETPVLLTNTNSVGVVRDATLRWMRDRKFFEPQAADTWYAYPVVAETYDGFLNDITGFHVTAEHAIAALDGAKPGAVAEGNVGGGTGMVCHGFKGGIGTASRKVSTGHVLGALVQANYGKRESFTVAGVPVGREITDLLRERGPNPPEGRQGSIIVVTATDAPLVPHQLKRLARRVPIGIGRVGGTGNNGSGDLFLAFSTANPGAAARHGVKQVQMLSNDDIDPLLEATIEAVEEAILNALVAAETMTGINGNTVYALPHDRLREALRKYNRTTP
jgi:L-aminopeptidase/D-esterase-like protein